jgi:hypothetical protein
MKRILNTLCFCITASLVSPALSACSSAPSNWTEETGPNIVEFGDWVVATIAERNQCWLYSNPIDSTIDNKDSSEEFCRGTSRLVINFFPGSNINGEFSYDSGYHFDASEEVLLETKNLTMNLPTREGGTAWTLGTKDDEAVINEFEANKYVEVHGTASSSVAVDDIFSLSGFSEALNRAKVECGLIDLMS